MGDVPRDRTIVATLILIALLAALPLWGPGMVNTRGGGDSPFLLQRTHQLLANLRAGVFPVRWMPDAAYGLGYPFFSYYAALPYYLAGFLALIGIDILTALKLVQTMGFIAAGLAMYGWMRQATGNRRAAWLAAVASTPLYSTRLSCGRWMPSVTLQVRRPANPPVCDLQSAIRDSALPLWPSQASSSPTTSPLLSFRPLRYCMR